MKRVIFLSVCVLSLVAVGAPKKKKGPPPPPPPVTEPMPKVSEALGDTVLNGIANATKVQVFRVADSGGLRPDPAKAILSDFIRGNPGNELDARALEGLRSMLYDDKSYKFESDVAKCRFVPHLSFQMQVGLETLEAVVSFSCNQVLFALGKQGGRWVPQGTFDVKPARKKLLELAKATLPQDKETQALK
ncbi:MAG: hypothetical protein JNM17_39100 [Archangium sp.]|nr:hypothetical protein [Archangium sp.]